MLERDVLVPQEGAMGTAVVHSCAMKVAGGICMELSVLENGTVQQPTIQFSQGSRATIRGYWGK